MNIQQFIYPQNQSQEDMRVEWLNHLIAANPVGINRVLNKYGFTGKYEPETREDTIEAIEMLIEQNGTDGIRDLMMTMPEFEAMRQLFIPDIKKTLRMQTPTVVTSAPEMRNATGSEVLAKLNISTDDLFKGAVIFALLYVISKKL